ncbi:hypothetical protein, partial [Ulvibacterium sp.]|uniref:RHS repeat domain-containing protein n=1 Tax=Ulvibacterium sp. TaxID=2665914 RepID=UPI00261B405A
MFYRIRNKYTLLLIMAMSFMLYSQDAKGQQHDTIDLLDISMGSPETSELAKYGNLQVSMYKGVPDISVPIHTLQLKGFSLPIALSYDNSGIKVDQIATNIGLGWSLQAGGQITSAIYSMNDIDNSLETMVTNPSNLNNFDPNEWIGGTSTIGKSDYDFAYGIFAGPLGGPGVEKNIKPDVFYFNYPGASGKFLMNGTAYSVPYNNHDIDFNGKSSGFTVTDMHGNEYIFDKLEESTSLQDLNACFGGLGSGNPDPDIGINVHYTWHLGKIITASGDEVVFTYDNSQTAYTYHDGEIEQLFEERTLGGATCPSVNSSNDSHYSCKTKKTVQPLRLEKIEHVRSGQSVEFKYNSTARADFGNSTYTKMDSIIVKQHGNTFKRFALDNAAYFSTGSTKEKKRLKLEGITQVGMPGYEFDYNTSGNLPERLSRNQDHWGYYNGAFNTTMVQDFAGISGGDRSVDTSKVGYWSMEKMTYPTGGSTVFDMEGIPTGGGQRVKTIYDLDVMGSIVDARHYSYEIQTFGSFDYQEDYEVYLDTDSYGSPSCTYYMYTSNNILPVHVMDAPDFGFSKVTVEYGNSGVNGKTIYEYATTLSDLTTSGVGDEGALSWGRGELIKTTHYNASDNPLTETEREFEVKRTANSLFNTTTTTNEKYFYGLDIQLKRPEREVSSGGEGGEGEGGVIGSGVSTTLPARFEVEKYRIVSAWYHPSKTTKTVYDPANFANYITTTTEYQYLNNDMVSQTTETNSRSLEVRTTHYAYAHQQYPGMATANMLAQPYSVEVKNGSATLAKNWTQWTNSSSISPGSKWRLHKTWQWEGSSPADGSAPAAPTSEAVLLSEVKTYDAYGNPVEVQDAGGIQTSYDWSEEATTPVGVFRNAAKEHVFAHSFALEGLDGWQTYDASNSVATTWSLEGGKLKMHHPGNTGSNWSTDYVKESLVNEITSRAVIEMDVTAGPSDQWSFIIGAGGNSYSGGNGGSENLIWAGFYYGSWRAYNGSSWVVIKSGFVEGETYHLKIVADPATDKVDYFVDGEKLQTALSGRTNTSGISVLSLGNYGRPSSVSDWYIDNVRVYPEAAQAASQEIDPLFRVPVAMKDAAGATSRYDYDNFGRLTKVYNAHGELITTNSYHYSLDSHSSYTASDPNRVESWTHYDPANPSNVTKSVQYMDGLGRPIQTQLRAANGTAILTDTRYNNRGLPEV